MVPEDPAGGVESRRSTAMLDERVKVVSLVHVPSNGGLVKPAAAVGALTRAAGIPLLLDACQSVGQMPVDVGEIGCDILRRPAASSCAGRAAPASSTCGAR